jgi:endonuclease/exonuclease/phosphatase (EEP) superfamily protein YafD
MTSPKPALGAQILRGLRTVLYLALAGATLATLAGWLSWWWWPGELASHFRVQYFWISVISFALLAATRRWYLTALAAVPMLLNFAVILPLYGPVVVTTDNRPVRRIASINVYYGNRRHADVLKFVRGVQPDVVLLMELTGAWRDLLADLRDDYPFQRTAVREDSFGIALISRIEWDDCQVLYFGTAGVPSIVARFDWSDEKLLLLGTHPLTPARSESWRLRNEQFAAIADRCQEEAGPVILIGDLNSTSWSSHFNTLLDGTRLRDSRTGFGVQPSWPAWSILPRIPIDHALVSPEVEVRNRFIGPDIGSDHFPLVLDVVLPKRAAEQD